jgi:hypothetical protein
LHDHGTLITWTVCDCHYVLQFTVGPGADSITVNEANSVSWRMLDVVYTTQPLLFKPLPLPHHTYIDFETSKAAPLALQVFNCADLKVNTCFEIVCWVENSQPAGGSVLFVLESCSGTRLAFAATLR